MTDEALPRRCPHIWPSGPDLDQPEGTTERCELGCETSRTRTEDGTGYSYPGHPLTADPPRPLSPAERARWEEIRGG